MGTALSKDLVRTAGTKLSLSKKEKQKKNFMGMDDPLASQKTSRATELETRLGKVEQAFLELNHTSGASSRAQTCHWDKLPTELKLRVFSYVGLIMGDPVRHPAMTGSKYQLETLNFRLVNKEFRTLYRDIWYKNNTFVVAPIWTHPLAEKRPIFSYPEPTNSQLVRSLQVELTVDWGQYALDMLRCQKTDWCRLLRPRPYVSIARRDERDAIKYEGNIFLDVSTDEQAGYCSCGETCSLDLSTTQWQDHFPLLDKLKIYLRIRGFIGCSRGCTRHSHERLRIFMVNVRLLMNASEIVVNAKDVEVRVHCSCERAAAFAQGIIQASFKRQAS